MTKNKHNVIQSISYMKRGRALMSQHKESISERDETLLIGYLDVNLANFALRKPMDNSMIDELI